MQSKFLRRSLIAAAACLIIAIAGLAALTAGLDAGYFRSPLLRYLEHSTGRHITVSGPLRVTLWSLHPSVSAQGVTLGNPPWTPPGITAQIDALTLVYDLPSWGHPTSIKSLQMQGATLTLFRDAAGRANWQRRDPDKTAAKSSLLINDLSALNARVQMDDRRRHMQFEGTVSAQAATGSNGAPVLQIQGAGALNGKPVALELTGDPLPAASREHPYHFIFSEQSSGSLLTAEGSLPIPFDFNLLEAKFEASGADLRDLYFLTGVSLVNTGSYRLTGAYSRDHSHTQFDDLHLSTGQSDLSGSVDIDVAGGRPRSNSILHARTLRLADFGLRAAGRETQLSSLLLSNTPLNVDTLRRGEAVFDLKAQRIEVGRQELQDFNGKLAIEHGVVTAAPLAAVLLGGKLSAQIKIDATQEIPLTELELSIAGMQLAQWPHESTDPPLDGALRVQLKLSGRGRSVHEVAASAAGTANAILPTGAIRASLAELAGMDLRGLGLTLEKSKRDTPVRCAVADFQANAGVFTVQRMVMDTEPVRIDGTGSIYMDTETLDLVLHGEPKSLRVLRLEAPLRIRGTLSHPAVGIEKGDSKLLLVDRGSAENADCAALVK